MDKKYDVENGLIGVERDVLIKIIHKIANNDKIRVVLINVFNSN
jgi:hypothetical protein